MNLGSTKASVDSRFDLSTYITDQQIQEIDEREEMDALHRLMQFPFQGKKELGKTISKYNGAKRIDISKLSDSRIVRSPRKFLTVLELLSKEASVTPSYGLQIKKGSKHSYVHFLLELTPTATVGVFFYDSKRMLSVPQVHNVERLIKAAGLKGGIIVANNVGIPAKQEAQRINQEHGGYGIITIEHYDSLEKRHLNK